MPIEPQPCASGAGDAGADVEQLLLCDLDAEGNLLGTALAVYEYDSTGSPVGPPTFVDPTTGNPYVPQGTLQPCPDAACLPPMQFCQTSTATGPVEHPGRQYDITLPINPGFAVQSLQVDAVNNPAGITWEVDDPDGEAFRQNLTTFIEGRVPASATVTITNPNAGVPQVCGAAQPMTVHIECVRLDQNPPNLIELVYNGGQDLIQNPAYNEFPALAPPVSQGNYGFHLLSRQDDPGPFPINQPSNDALCTTVANRGWETNDIGRTFEIWGKDVADAQNTTPTPRGTPVQEMTSDGAPPGGLSTIWQTFTAPASGNFVIRVVHGAREAGETHRITLDNGDTDDAQNGDLIDDVTNPPSVTSAGGPNPWTQFNQTIPLNSGSTYTLALSTTNPVAPNRGGLFTDMRAYIDRPDLRATATTDDDTCVVTTDETTTNTTCSYWQPQCAGGAVVGWQKVDTGETMTNAAFWAQVPTPSCCLPDSGGEGGASATLSNMLTSDVVCATVGGVAQNAIRVVVTDPSGGTLQEQFLGTSGAPIAPDSWTAGACTAGLFVEDQVLCDTNGPFLRKYVQSLDATNQARVNSFRDFTLAGGAYAAVGQVGVCAGGETLGEVCYTDPDLGIGARGFLTRDSDGTAHIYDQSGVEVTPFPTIVICPETSFYEEILCDQGNSGHQFIRRYAGSPIAGASTQLYDFELDGETDYVPVGPVTLCTATETDTPEALTLCDITVVPGLDGARAALNLTTLPNGPTAGSFSNGIGYTVDQGTAGGSGTYLINGSSTQTWTFDQPAMLRFGVNNLNVGAECVTLPVGTVVESIHPNHTYNAGTRVLCNGGAADPADESIFTLGGATTLAITSNPGGGGQRGLVRLEAGLTTFTEVRTPFLRTICRTCGEAPVVTDTALDAVTPYVPVGTVSVCDVPFTPAEATDCNTAASIGTVCYTPPVAVQTLQDDWTGATSVLGGGSRVWTNPNFAGQGITVTETVTPDTGAALLGAGVRNTATSPASQHTAIDLGAPRTNVTVRMDFFGSAQGERLRNVSPAFAAVSGNGTAVLANTGVDGGPAGDGTIFLNFPGPVQNISWDYAPTGGGLSGQTFISFNSGGNASNSAPAAVLRDCDTGATTYVDLATGTVLNPAQISIVDCPDATATDAVDRVDAETQILCDANATRFLRTYAFDAAGAVSGFTDRTLAGAAFAPVGAVGVCTTAIASDFDFLSTVLCDANGTSFIQRLTFNSATGAVTATTNTTLTGGAFVPVAPVGLCSSCCPVVMGEGCTNVGSLRYTALRLANGTISLIDSVTGAAVAAANIVVCAPANGVLPGVAADHFEAVPGTPWTPAAIPAGRRLVSLTYSVLAGTATVVDATGGTSIATIPAGYSATWTAQDDRETLTPPASITSVGGRVIVLMLTAA